MLDIVLDIQDYLYPYVCLFVYSSMLVYTVSMAVVYGITMSTNMSNRQHTRQTDPLTEQHIKYRDITAHSPQLMSKRQ